MIDSRFEISSGVLVQTPAGTSFEEMLIEKRLITGLQRTGLMVGLGNDSEKLKLTLIGKFTRNAVPRFKELANRLLELNYCRIQVDMLGIQKLDGNGLAALVWLTAQAKERNGQVVLSHLPHAVSRVVLASHAHYMLNISDYELAG